MRTCPAAVERRPMAKDRPAYAGGTPPKERNTTAALADVNRIMVAEVAAATSGSTPISSISGPCQGFVSHFSA